MKVLHFSYVFSLGDKTDRQDDEVNLRIQISNQTKKNNERLSAVLRCGFALGVGLIKATAFFAHL